MEYIIKVSREVISVKKDREDLIKFAKSCKEQGFTIEECYEKDGISKMRAEILANLPKGVFPDAGTYNGALLAKVRNSPDAKDVKTEILKQI